jgi:hypothetical protein
MFFRYLQLIAISSAIAAAVALSLAALLTPVPGLEPQRTRGWLI